MGCVNVFRIDGCVVLAKHEKALREAWSAEYERKRVASLKVFVNFYFLKFILIYHCIHLKIKWQSEMINANSIIESNMAILIFQFKMRIEIKLLR